MEYYLKKKKNKIKHSQTKKRLKLGTAPWVPYEFYSASCQRTYKLPQNGVIRRDDDVVCRDEYSDISPTSGAAAAFSTLQSRPGANKFEESATLQVRSSAFFFVFFLFFFVVVSSNKKHGM